MLPPPVEGGARKGNKNVGLDQCNVRLPTNLAGAGNVNLTLTVDGNTSNVVTMQIK